MNDTGFKQRLIGAAVLIALAVLFLPVILDGKKAQYFEENLIPEIPEDSQMAELAASLSESAITTTEEQITINETNTTGTDANKTALAYIVQVASFASEENAKQLVGRLKSQHLKAFVGREKVSRDGQLLSRVLIGPMLNKTDAEKTLSKLESNKDFKASVVEFDPLKH